MTFKLLCLAALGLWALNTPAQARLVRSWTGADLQKTSDLIVIGTPIAVKKLEEHSALGYGTTFLGIETTFKVCQVLKGHPTGDKIVLHHYAYPMAIGSTGSLANGPHFISFEANSTKKYKLYLVKEESGRCAPVSGQVDPCYSVQTVPGSAN